MVNEQSPELDILGIFERLSSDETRSVLVDLSLFPEETGGKIDDVVDICQMVETEDELGKAYDELRQFGLVEKGRMVEGKFTPAEDGDRIRLAKGVQTAVRKQITKEI